MMNDIDLSQQNINNDDYLSNIINKNNKEIMSMKELIIYDSLDKILGEVDFINETILQHLCCSPQEYLGKDIRIIQYDQNKLYQIIFKDNSRIKIVIENNKQCLFYLGKFPESLIPIGNNDINNINN